MELRRRNFVKALGTGVSIAPMGMAGLGAAHAGSEKTVVRRRIPGIKMALTEEEFNIMDVTTFSHFLIFSQNSGACGCAFVAHLCYEIRLKRILSQGENKSEKQGAPCAEGLESFRVPHSGRDVHEIVVADPG
ncbi:MAG: hypothetical protein A4E72_01068 [Syntrophus sp. PtaU1.Bin208]|nr:MAG: hypothetical protein A4E72_01068 [Syntrophus sp. PtaU1.Bin208]